MNNVGGPSQEKTNYIWTPFKKYDMYLKFTYFIWVFIN